MLLSFPRCDRCGEALDLTSASIAAVVLSKSQIDKLGERLQAAQRTEADLCELDEYRRSFGEAYEKIVGKIREELGLEPTGRPAKSTPAIVEKLRDPMEHERIGADVAALKVKYIENLRESILGFGRKDNAISD